MPDWVKLQTCTSCLQSQISSHICHHTTLCIRACSCHPWTQQCKRLQMRVACLVYQALRASTYTVCVRHVRVSLFMDQVLWAGICPTENRSILTLGIKVCTVRLKLTYDAGCMHVWKLTCKALLLSTFRASTCTRWIHPTLQVFTQLLWRLHKQLCIQHA